MADVPTTYSDDPTAAQGPFRLNPPGETGGLEPVQPLAAPGTALALPQLERLEQRRQETFQKREQEVDQEATDLAQAYRNRPQTPGLGKVGPAPDAQDFQKNTMAFFSVMSVLGALMPGISRGAGNAALNAFGGALDGWHKGNLEAYENASKQWEQNTKAMIENNNFLIKQYDMELQNTALNIEQMQANIKLKAAQFHDKIGYDNAENINVIAQYRDKLEKANNELTRVLKTTTDQTAKINAEVDLKAAKQALWVAEHGFTRPDGSPMSTEELVTTKYLLSRDGGKAVVDLSPVATDPETIERLARQDLTGDHSWRSNYGKGIQGSGVLKAVDARKTQIMRDENITPEQVSDREIKFRANLAGAASEQRAFGTTAGNLRTIIHAAYSAIPRAEELSSTVARTGFVPLNKLMQIGEKNITNENLKKFLVANLNVAELWAKAMNVRGVMRESDRELALQNLYTADTPQNYRAALDELKVFLEREQTAVKEARDDMPLGSLTGGGAAPAQAPAAAGWGKAEKVTP